MKKSMMWITAVMCGCFVLNVIGYVCGKIDLCLTLAITFGTIFYHFLMRLLVGGVIGARYHNHMDSNHKWFQEKKFEASLYQKLQVKKWKDRMPTYNTENFQMKSGQSTQPEQSMKSGQSTQSEQLIQLESVIGATCQAEVIHECIMVLSFVPIVFAIWFGALDVFVITSMIACCIDGMFVIMQRYNRPRLEKLTKAIRRQEKRRCKHEN